MCVQLRLLSHARLLKEYIFKSAEREIIDPFITKRLTSAPWGRAHGEAVTVIVEIFLLKFFNMQHELVTSLFGNFTNKPIPPNLYA